VIIGVKGLTAEGGAARANEAMSKYILKTCDGICRGNLLITRNRMGRATSLQKI